ncbi:amidohydrolase [Bifidobacterium saguinibicoloris]|uniref:amidohydrolase n=1 Tax=Bifidobacterium saguinibicoloris TaxID=2834433 RepID=UPI001C592D0F|nr:amidohydrolase [Bifidobacterium saguinibicoloris]MBW3081488.1 amidohydrolase [Bifidobacterium saguinibicoloris]
MAGMSDMSNDLNILNARVPGKADAGRVDLGIRDGRVVSVAPAASVGATAPAGSGSVASVAAVAPAATTIDASDLWVIPGLMDCHTHFTQWSKTLGRLDLIDARSASEAMTMLRAHLDERRASGTLDPNAFVVGMRFRHSLWSDDQQPTLVAIDEAAGEQPVALSSADMHCGWVNSAAARRLGVHPDPKTGLVGELEWFEAYKEFDKAPGAAEETDRLLREAEADAAGKGVTGIRDYEMAENIDTWIARFKAGINRLRVAAGVYPERLAKAIEDGWHSGKPLPGSRGLGMVGAMKLISDGSLNTRSAYCSTPYSGIEPPTCGVLSYTPEQIEDYMRLATGHGFAIACHAIGDEANTIVLDAAERTHAHGSIEHAQLLKPRDIPRLAALGLEASIQPQHAMDDRDVISRFWAHPAGIPYAFRSLYDAGTTLRMGSDAPVAPLDPWLAISAAVFETEDSAREPFQPEQCLPVDVALASSTATGRVQPEPGDPADLVLLDADPYAQLTPEEMRGMPRHVVMTFLAGERVH